MWMLVGHIGMNKSRVITNGMYFFPNKVASFSNKLFPCIELPFSP